MSERTCEWCESPMAEGRSVCPSCGRLASRLSLLEDAAEPRGAVPPPSAPPPPPPPPPAADPPVNRHLPKLDDPLPPTPPASAWREVPEPEPEPRPTPWKVIGAVAAVLVVLAAAALAVVISTVDDDTAAKATTTVPGPATSGPLTTDRPTERTSTSTTSTTSTTLPTRDGRTVVTANLGFEWTMQAAPTKSAERIPEGADAPGGVFWQSDLDGRSEQVSFLDPKTLPVDLDDALTRVATSFDGTLGDVKDSPLAGTPGRTANFTGPTQVGWIISATIDGHLVTVLMTQEGTDVGALYPQFLQLVSSVEQT